MGHRAGREFSHTCGEVWVTNSEASREFPSHSLSATLCGRLNPSTHSLSATPGECGDPIVLVWEGTLLVEPSTYLHLCAHIGTLC